MKRKFIANKKAMSIVISTVIIIAISITMSIAIAFWAMGVGNSFTRFEKIEFVSIYVDSTTNQATAALSSVNASGGITGIMVTNVGSGYTVIPSVSIVNNVNGSGATARVTGLSNGIITGITITNAGTGYSMQNPPTITIAPPAVTAVPSFPIYIQLKNTGSAAATINNVFLDGKPFSVVGATTNLISGSAQSTVLQVGQRRNDFYIYLPMGSTWSSGDYVEIEIQTSAGRQYSNTVLLP
jgi:hypothetical protein